MGRRSRLNETDEFVLPIGARRQSRAHILQQLPIHIKLLHSFFYPKKRKKKLR